MKRRLDIGHIEIMDDATAEMLRGKTVTERIEMVFAANRTMRLRIKTGLRTRHPDWSNEQVTAEVARRMLGGELADGLPDGNDTHH